MLKLVVHSCVSALSLVAISGQAGGSTSKLSAGITDQGLRASSEHNRNLLEKTQV